MHIKGLGWHTLGMGKKEPANLSFNILMKDLIIQLNLLTQVHVTCVIIPFLKIYLNGWFITLDVISKKTKGGDSWWSWTLEELHFSSWNHYNFLVFFLFIGYEVYFIVFHGVSTPRLEISDGMLFVIFFGCVMKMTLSCWMEDDVLGSGNG